ncbi:FxsA family protein [Corynebacterium glyciniphilum]|uniref:FxsA family protein n=1 Tax=Corynebacterium glyciniphilum TaxID=1404244 RepID=UPI00264C0475|nr:FxsA family protein [Corynebacterium glyciniphilum]MDN6704828.1 FxsA family protein [Corynebacterium glyciniphilum]
MSRLLPLLYIVAEILVFFLLGSWIGFGWTILLVLATFIGGMMLAGWQFRELVRRSMTDRAHPGQLTADAALSAVGAVLVALPGLVTAVLGIVLLLPPTRSLVRRGLGGALRRRITSFGGASFTTVSGVSMPQTKDVDGWGEVIDHRADEFDDRDDSNDRDDRA